ncbi:hypothetical protein PS687_05711 [Pseudomonas fluorescens]|nr:hypothetical protein PS687_05711 [Pseudomonas fluorescens]
MYVTALGQLLHGSERLVEMTFVVLVVTQDIDNRHIEGFLSPGHASTPRVDVPRQDHDIRIMAHAAQIETWGRAELMVKVRIDADFQLQVSD